MAEEEITRRISNIDKSLYKLHNAAGKCLELPQHKYSNEADGQWRLNFHDLKKKYFVCTIAECCSSWKNIESRSCSV